MDLTAEAIQEIAKLGLAASVPAKVGDEGLWLHVDPAGKPQIIDLTADQYRDFPKRIIGTTTLFDVASFLTYWDTHSSDSSVAYANHAGSGEFTITAIIDAHHGVEASTVSRAAWQQHRAVCKLALSDPLKTWLHHSDKYGTQDWFVEFIEDNIAFIVAPAGADLKEMVAAFEASSQATFSAKVNTHSGARVLSFTEQVDATMKGGTVEVPKTMTLALPMWRGDRDPAEYTVFEAAIRFRLNSPTQGKLAIGYKMIRPQDMIDAAFAATVEQVAEHIGKPVLFGTPNA